MLGFLSRLGYLQVPYQPASLLAVHNSKCDVGLMDKMLNACTVMMGMHKWASWGPEWTASWQAGWIDGWVDGWLDGWDAWVCLVLECAQESCPCPSQCQCHVLTFLVSCCRF